MSAEKPYLGRLGQPCWRGVRGVFHLNLSLFCVQTNKDGGDGGRFGVFFGVFVCVEGPFL